MVNAVAVDSSVASEVAAFTRVACPYDLLSTAAVNRSIFADPDPQLVVACYDGGLEGVGAAVVRGERGWVKFIAVHPHASGRGVGTELLHRMESFCADNGARTIEVGTSAPYYVTPGIDVRCTEALCFFEKHGYVRTGDTVNLGARLTGLDAPPLPCHSAAESDLEALLLWVGEHYPQWTDELTRSVALGTCVVHRDLGFACYDVNRDGWFGPMATHPQARGRDVGTSTLLSVLRRMKEKGYERAEIAWPGPIRFYLKTAGAHVTRVFWCYAKTL